MSAIDTSLNYLSSWDIDQLVATDVVTAGIGATALYTIPSTLPPIPVYDVQFRPTGSTVWYQAGIYSTNGTIAAGSSFYTYVLGNVLYIFSAGGSARYFIWSDKVNY